jgi:hypothetical protein
MMILNLMNGRDERNAGGEINSCGSAYLIADHPSPEPWTPHLSSLAPPRSVHFIQHPKYTYIYTYNVAGIVATIIGYSMVPETTMLIVLVTTLVGFLAHVMTQIFRFFGFQQTDQLIDIGSGSLLFSRTMMK